jgi:hypothetical protein
MRAVAIALANQVRGPAYAVAPEALAHQIFSSTGVLVTAAMVPVPLAGLHLFRLAPIEEWPLLDGAVLLPSHSCLVCMSC